MNWRKVGRRILAAEAVDALLTLTIMGPLIGVDATLAAWIEARWAAVPLGLATAYSVRLALRVWAYWRPIITGLWTGA